MRKVERKVLPSQEKRKEEVTLTFLCAATNNGHLRQNKLIPSSSHPSFYPHHTKHKEVRACSTNKCWGPTQRKYNEPYAVKADYKIANYFYKRIAK